MPKLVAFNQDTIQRYQEMRKARSLRPALGGTTCGVFLAYDDGDLLSGCLLYLGNGFCYVEDFCCHPDATPEDTLVAMSATLDYLRAFCTISGLWIRITAESEAVVAALKRKGFEMQRAVPFVLRPGQLEGLPKETVKKAKKKAKRGKRNAEKAAEAG